MATGSLIPLLYGGCICMVLAIVGVGAGLYWWGRAEERRNARKASAGAAPSGSAEQSEG